MFKSVKEIGKLVPMVGSIDTTQSGGDEPSLQGIVNLSQDERVEARSRYFENIRQDHSQLLPDFDDSISRKSF